MQCRFFYSLVFLFPLTLPPKIIGKPVRLVIVFDAQYVAKVKSTSVSSSLPFTFSVPKTYGFRTKNIRFWDGERTVLGRKP